MPPHNVPMKPPASDSGSEYDFLEEEENHDPNVFRIVGALTPPTKRDITIEKLHEMVHNGDIDTEAPYQRDVVWITSKMTGLIDSIWKNFHIPALVFVAKKDSDGDETLVCVDGKQRLTSIVKFMDGTIPHKIDNQFWWWTRPNRKQANHHQISDNDKRTFCERTISCDIYRNLTEEAEREMFRRVQMGVVLSPAEKLRAASSPMATFISELEQKHVHIAGGLGEILSWDLKRGKPFQNLMVMTYYCENYPEERLWSTAVLEKWIQSEAEPSEAFKRDITQVLNDLWKIASNDNLNEPFTYITNVVAPVEFIFFGVLLYVLRDCDLRTKSSALKSIRQAIRKVYGDLRMRNDIIKSLWGYIKHFERNPHVDLSTKGPRPRGRPPGKTQKRKVETVEEDGDYRAGRSTRRR